MTRRDGRRRSSAGALRPAGKAVWQLDHSHSLYPGARTSQTGLHRYLPLRRLLPLVLRDDPQRSGSVRMHDRLLSCAYTARSALTHPGSVGRNFPGQQNIGNFRTAKTQARALHTWAACDRSQIMSDKHDNLPRRSTDSDHAPTFLPHLKNSMAIPGSGPCLTSVQAMASRSSGQCRTSLQAMVPRVVQRRHRS